MINGIGGPNTQKEKLTAQESGRLGGLSTVRKYGRQFYVDIGRLGHQVMCTQHPDMALEWGKLGGRPRSITYDDIRQRQLLEQNNKKEVMGSLGTLREQKRLFAARQRSNGVLVTSTEAAGIAQETPHEQVPAGKEAT